TINVRNGTYEELLYLNGKDNVTIKGESRDGVVIQYANYDTLNPGTGGSQSSTVAGSPAGGRAVMLVEASDLLGFDTLSLKNSTLTHGPGPGALHSDVPAGATYLARSPGGTASWDNIAFINTKMDMHINAAGWAGLGVNSQPAPNPTVATAAAGWREYGSTDLAGAPLNLGLRVGGYLLTDTDVANSFATRAKVFALYSTTTPWNPQ